MRFWYVPSPVPYRPHPASWRQPLHLHLAPLWAALRRVLPTLRGRVLDVGCGDKPYRALLPASVTAYVGVDRQRGHGAPAGPDVLADAHALPFADGAFDAVVSFQVFEHLADPARALAECTRVLRPGGDLVLTVPGVWPAHELPHDYWRFTRYGLETLTAGAGLTLVELTPLGGFWSTLGQMACLELDRSIPGRALVPLVNLAARALDGTAREHLVMNWLLHARRP